MTDTITPEQAQEMGAKGAPATESERLLFEAWMLGHCWKVEGNWTDGQYLHESEKSGMPHAGAMRTRQLWAAWRDRAALVQQAPQVAQQAEQVPELEKRPDYILGFEAGKKSLSCTHGISMLVNCKQCDRAANVLAAAPKGGVS